MCSWEKLVREEVSAVNSTSRLALRNHLPDLLKNISEVIENYSDRSALERKLNLSDFKSQGEEHGRHRATLSKYSIDQVIWEYFVLRRCILRTLTKQLELSQELNYTVTRTIEVSIMHSALEFSESIRDMQEELMATLAHDIRNPITTSLGFSELLLDETDRNLTEEYVAIMRRKLKQALTLTEGLLHTVRVKAGEGMTLNLTEGDYIEEIKSIYKEAKAIYNQPFVCHCEAHQVNAVFDKIAIKRAMENLITNSVKYGDRDQPIKISLFQQDDWVNISVWNSGKAILPEKQKSIFKLFGRRNEQAGDYSLESWGIGLALVKMVAEAHGGTVELHSAPDEGTTFTMKLKKFPAEPGQVYTKLNLQQQD